MGDGYREHLGGGYPENLILNTHLNGKSAC